MSAYGSLVMFVFCSQTGAQIELGELGDTLHADVASSNSGQYAVPGSAASADATAARLAIIKRRTEAGLVEFEERYDQALSREGRVKREERHEGRLWRRQGTHSREWSITTRAAELVTLMRTLRLSSSELEQSRAVAASTAMPGGGGMRDTN